MNTLASLTSFCFVNVYIYIHAYSLLSSSQYPRLLISVQAVVFKALTVIFRDLFYLYFIKGISLQRTNKRSVPNLNVRNPVLRGYKQISCPAVKSLLLNCFFCLVSYTAQGTLAFEGLCLPFPRRDRVGHHRTCGPEDGWTAGPGDSWPLGFPKCICHQVCGEEHNPGSSWHSLVEAHHDIQDNTERLCV